MGGNGVGSCWAAGAKSLKIARLIVVAGEPTISADVDSMTEEVAPGKMLGEPDGEGDDHQGWICLA